MPSRPNHKVHQYSDWKSINCIHFEKPVKFACGCFGDQGTADKERCASCQRAQQIQDERRGRV